MAKRVQPGWQRGALLLVPLLLSTWWWQGHVLAADSGTDYAGTVAIVDAWAGKLVVKKEGGGSRFTFVVNDKTRFDGPGVKSLKDVKQGSAVTVNYVVQGSQYVALKVTAKGQ